MGGGLLERDIPSRFFCSWARSFCWFDLSTSMRASSCCQEDSISSRVVSSAPRLPSASSTTSRLCSRVSSCLFCRSRRRFSSVCKSSSSRGLRNGPAVELHFHLAGLALGGLNGHLQVPALRLLLPKCSPGLLHCLPGLDKPLCVRQSRIQGCDSLVMSVYVLVNDQKVV